MAVEIFIEKALKIMNRDFLRDPSPLRKRSPAEPAYEPADPPPNYSRSLEIGRPANSARYNRRTTKASPSFNITMQGRPGLLSKEIRDYEAKSSMSLVIERAATLGMNKDCLPLQLINTSCVLQGQPLVYYKASPPTFSSGFISEKNIHSGKRLI
ncbi:hypothetical protein CDAR_239001 [Caerostris darwini]|uniref:Uncharacterized protein n=1 Tax=Caerostris darwini TaxID=1538125 RepID=A0AAV4PT69_9ARAC|nr:hypothetical protein CDAR_239001 [Caerostris darwini]